MDTQNNSVFDLPATQQQPHTTEQIDVPAKEPSVAMQDLLTPDLFAPEQLRLAI